MLGRIILSNNKMVLCRTIVWIKMDINLQTVLQ
jgi:hypothetical protein